MIVDPDFCDHWKTRTLVGLLGGDEAAPVYVLRIWAHCQNRRQFKFDGISSEALKALCHFPGPANKLESSLVASGFVRRDASVLLVLGWDEYNSSLIASWNNGAKGGRPPGKKPSNNPGETQGKPRGLREEKNGLDEIRKPSSSSPSISNGQFASANSSAAGGGDGGDLREGTWESVERRLVFLQVADVRGAMDAPRRNGISPAAVQDIITHWVQKGLWSLGALVWRLKNGTAVQGQADGWPKPDATPRPKYKKPEEKTQQEIDTLKRRLIREFNVNEARDYDDRKVLAKAAELQLL